MLVFIVLWHWWASQVDGQALLFLPIGQIHVQERLFLRIEPDLAAPNNGRARWGDTLLIYEQQGDWVRADGGWLWLDDQVLVPAVVHYSARPIESFAAIPLLAPDETSMISVDAELGVLALWQDQALIYGDGFLGWVEKNQLGIFEPSATLLELTEQSAYLKRLSSPVYSLPNAQSEVITSLELGQVVQVVYQHEEWGLVRAGTRYGWMALADLDIIPQVMGVARITSGPINLRAAPIDGAVTNALAFEEQVFLLGRNAAADWIYIRVARGEDRITGWVAAQFVGWDHPLDELPILD